MARSAILFGEIEGKDSVYSVWALQYLRMAKRTNGIGVAGLPMLLHRTAGKLVIFGATFIILGAVNQLYKILDFLIRVLRQQFDLRRLQQVLRQLLKEFRHCPASQLHLLELIGCGPRAAGKPNLFVTKFNLHQVARQFAARAPQIDLKNESVLPRAAFEHPLQRVLETRPPSQ